MVICLMLKRNILVLTRISTKNREEKEQRQAREKTQTISSWTILWCFKSKSVETLQTSKYRRVSTKVNDGCDSPCTAKYITGSCTHSNFMGDSDSFFQDGLFLQHLDFLTTRSASQASLPANLIQVSTPFRQHMAGTCSPHQSAGGCSYTPQEESQHHSTGVHQIESKKFLPNLCNQLFVLCPYTLPPWNMQDMKEKDVSHWYEKQNPV